MSTAFNLLYNTSLQRELAVAPECKKCTINITPYNIQKIVYETIRNIWLFNDPANFGYNFSERYSLTQENSSISISTAYQWDLKDANKRPSITILRNDTTTKAPVLNQLGGVLRPQESYSTKAYIAETPLNILFVGENATGQVEQIAEFTYINLLGLEEAIRNDFELMRFRVGIMSGIQPYKEAKNNFIITVRIETAYAMSFIVQGDDLKLKTVAPTIYLNGSTTPLTEQ